MAKKKRNTKKSSDEAASVEEMETNGDLPAEEDVNPDDGEGADLSMCDASFRAEDAVPTSGHDVVSRCTQSRELFLAAIAAHQDRSQEFDFEESLGTLTPEEFSALWTSLNQYLASGDNEEERLETLVGVVLVTKISVTLETLTPESCPSGLQSAMFNLHNRLPQIKDHKISNNICQSLETWYSRSLPEKDALIINVVIFLLKKSLGGQGAKADVKRLWNVHQTLLEHRTAESDQLNKLLIATAGSNLFLTTPEGIRWLVFLYSLSPDLVSSLHKQSRASLATISKGGCQGLGEVYHKAWLASGGEFRTLLELDCIQDLMYRGVLASRERGGVSGHVARVLSYFRQQERSQPTLNLLARLYEPILWRNLKVANHDVRLNACELFLSNYPIEDFDQTREERDNNLEMQHSFMLNLIRDEHPKVRCEAIRGVCQVLATFWLLIPSETINQIINIMIKELVWDSSNPRVRMTTIRGVATLLRSPHSHVYMKAVLPRLSDCLHDTNENVRGAVIDLLQAVKGLRSIKFWNVCSVENLLARLEKDKAFICRRITKLLFNSYLPSAQSEEVKLERCIHMIKMNKAASRRFYQYAAECLDVESCMVFMMNILTSVKQWIKAKSGANLEGDDKENYGKKRRKLYTNSESSMMSDDNTESSTMLEDTTTNTTVANNTTAAAEVFDSEDHPYNDLNVVGGILDIVCVIWRAKIADICKSENDELRSALEKKAGKWMTLFFKYFKSTPVISTIVYFSSYLPERSVAPVASYCLARVKEEEGWMTHVDSLCNWRKGNSLLELVADGIRNVLAGQEKSGSSKGVRFEEPVNKDGQLKLSLKLMKYLMNNQTNRVILMAKNKPMLEEVLTVCSGVQDYIGTRLGFNDTSGTSTSDIGDIISLYGQLNVLLRPENSVTIVEELMSWSEREVLPVLETRDDNIEGSRTRDQISLATHVLQNINKLVVSGLCLGLGDPDHVDKCLDWSLEILTEAGVSQLSGMLTILSVTAETASHRDTWSLLYQEKVPVNFAKLLNWLTGNHDQVDTEDDHITKYKQGIMNLFKIYSKNKSKDYESWEDLVDVTIAAVIAIMVKKVNEEGEVVIEQQSKVVTTTVEVITKVAGVDFTGAAVQRMLKDLESEENQNKAPNLAAYLALSALVQSKNKIDIIDNIINMVKQELDTETEERGISYTSLLQEIETVANEMKSN